MAALRGSVDQARAVLQRVLHGRLTFAPRGDGGYDFSGPTRFDKLFTGILVKAPEWMRGDERLRLADDNEAEYAQLLEMVFNNHNGKSNGKGVASPGKLNQLNRVGGPVHRAA